MGSTPTGMKDKLELIYMEADSLELLEGNPRQLKDSEGVKKLKTLIEEHGFQNPLQVWKGGDNGNAIILCGNHRFIAGVELGMKSFPCIVYHGDKARALARAISDNKSGEWTEWRLPNLPNLLTEIDTGEFSVPDLTGFSEVELAGVLEDSSWDSDVDALDKIKETDEGIRGIIKITCEPEEVDEVKKYIESKLNEVSFVGVTID